jgi:flagellar hook-associated protein 2
MGTISSGIGLISGLDTQTIISQLVAIESRPRQIVEEQVQILSSQKTGYLDVNARLLSLKLSADSFLDSSSFGVKRATSSNPEVLTASADTDAPLGTYQFTVDRLVSTHQMISRGFGNADTTALGIDTTMLIESAAARLDRDVELADLNGSDGVSRGTIRITDRSGNIADIDLSRAVTLDDVVNTINNAAGVAVTASVNTDGLVITDNTGQTTSNLIIANVGSTGTATSLGIVGNSGGTDVITGTQINKLLGTTNLSALNDGIGVRALGSGQDDLSIDDGTSTFNVSLDGADTIADVLDAINNATGNTTVTASIAADGTSLRLEGAAAMTVTALNSSSAARDLGIAEITGVAEDGQRILAGLGSRLIRNVSNGDAISAQNVSFDTGSGAQVVDLSSASNISGVISLINDAGAGVTASLNDAGNGLKITADNGQSMTIADDSGNFMTSFGLAGTHTDGTADGGDVDFVYISESTRLDKLNGGQGVAEGQFVITDSTGATATVDLTQGESTLKEVIAEINSRPVGVTATINATGDGLLLTDTAGGSLDMTIAESGSSTAADLGILGTATGGVLDGSFEKSVTIEATDTLNDVADKLNAADVGVTATVINDGTDSAPFRLSLSSDASGRDGRVLFDDGGLDLRADTLVEGRDAVVFFGSSNPAEAVLLTSSSNSLTDTIAGVSIDLSGTSDQAVSLTISRDTDTIVESVKKFVDDFNGVMDRINSLDSFNSDTEERGLLLGDPTLAAVRRRLLDIATDQYSDVSGQYTRLFEVGVTVGSNNNIELDETRLREAISTDLEAVTELFSLKTESVAGAEEIAPGVTVPSSGSNVTAKGVGATLEDLLEGLTDSIDGTLTVAANRIDSQIEISNDRIDQLTLLLDAKRLQLERQFAAMEITLANLQAQQSSLQSLSLLAFNTQG